jgi:hypothetical protein
MKNIIMKQQNYIEPYNQTNTSHKPTTPQSGQPLLLPYNLMTADLVKTELRVGGAATCDRSECALQPDGQPEKKR